MTLHQIIQQASFCIFTSLAVLWGANNSSFGQTATPQTSETPEVELAEEQKQTAEELAELDALLLGPWAFLIDYVQGEIDREKLAKAVSRCQSIPKINRLDIEPGAERKLPKAEYLHGDIVYFRTEKGLQRFDTKSGRMNLLSEHRKFDKAGKIAWAVWGKANGYRLLFTDTSKRGGKGLFMLEFDNLYLRCGIVPDVKPATPNPVTEN